MKQSIFFQTCSVHLQTCATQCAHWFQKYSSHSKDWFQKSSVSSKEFLKKHYDNLPIYKQQFRNELQRRLDEEKNFVADTSLATLRKPTVSAHLILWSSFLFLILFLLWAGFAVLEEVTVGEGKVVTSSKIQIVQNLEGGIISEIRAKEGMSVKKNQILMVIDDTRFASSYQEGEFKAYAIAAKVARLTAEAQDKEFVAPEDKELKKHPEFVENEKNLFLSRKKEQNTKKETLFQQEQQQSQELISLQAHQEQLKGSYELLVKELKMTKPLLARGAVSEVEILRLERQVNDLAGELKKTELALPKLKSSIAETRNKIEELNATFRATAQNELNAAKAELASLSASNVGLADRVERTLVRSPVDGTIKKLNVATQGGVVQPGMDLIEIVPSNDTLLIEARIRPSDIGFLHPGQKATVKITAYDYAIYGGLEGNVEEISADTITDEKGNSFYKIYVRTKNTDLGNKNHSLSIKPGMMASVDILTGEKTVLDYLLKPILKAKHNALRER